MRLVDLDNATLAVHEWAPATGPALFFWHALGGHIDYGDLPGVDVDRAASEWVDAVREHVGRFHEAIPGAEVRWAENAGHGIVADVGPLLGDEIAVWLAANVDEP